MDTGDVQDVGMSLDDDDNGNTVESGGRIIILCTHPDAEEARKSHEMPESYIKGICEPLWDRVCTARENGCDNVITLKMEPQFTDVQVALFVYHLKAHKGKKILEGKIKASPLQLHDGEHSAAVNYAHYEDGETELCPEDVNLAMMLAGDDDKIKRYAYDMLMLVKLADVTCNEGLVWLLAFIIGRMCIWGRDEGQCPFEFKLDEDDTYERDHTVSYTDDGTLEIQAKQNDHYAEPVKFRPTPISEVVSTPQLSFAMEEMEPVLQLVMAAV